MLVIEDSSESTHSVVYSNKYMDRQTLLEQKRQRLQELKLRRLNQSEAATEIDELVDRLQYEPKLSVSVAVQTDAPTSDRHAHNYIHSEAGDPHGKGTTMHSDREKITYDKGIQAGVAVEIIQESAEEAVEPAIAEEVVGPSEEDLNSSLEKSLKTLNKLLLQDSAETDFFVDGESLKESLIRPSTSSAFSVTQILPGVEDRTIAAMDVSPRKSVIVVSYQKNSLLQKQQQQQLRLGLQADHPTSFESVIRSPGLAVVYNLQGSKPIPEAYLLATSPIFSIKFDKSGGSVSKLIGGLRSGKVVIWEVNDDSMAFLPLLISPILSSNSTSLIKGSAALGEKTL